MSEEQLNSFRDKCLEDISEITGIKKEFITSSSRGVWTVIEARFMLYRALYFSGFHPSMKDVAKLVNRKNHTTIHYGLQESSMKIALDMGFRELVMDLEARGYAMAHCSIGEMIRRYEEAVGLPGGPEQSLQE